MINTTSDMKVIRSLHIEEDLKMATYYLAVDIGASSGRHILGHMENGKMILEEIYRFENGIKVRLEGEGYTGRSAPINTAGQIYPIGGGMTMNAAVSGPWQGGEVYAAVNNLFDTPLVNPTATSVRNLNVYSWGRTATVGYRKTF